MSFFFWFPFGIGCGVLFVIWSYRTDFQGIRTMIEQDIADAGDEGDVWAAFHSPESEERDAYKLEELMQRTQIVAALLMVLVGLLILIGPW
jgi:hypothetical protein